MTSILVRSGLLAVLIAASPLPLAAQDTTVVAVGTRLRITTDLSTVVGSLQPSPADSLVIGRTDGPLSLPRERIVELESYAGSRTYKARGAVIGGLVLGLAAGTVTWFAYGDDGHTDCNEETDPGCAFVDAVVDTQRGPAAALVGVIGAAVGAGIGALIGSKPRDQYEEVPAPWRVQ